jgi:predicted phosphohydrolase
MIRLAWSSDVHMDIAGSERTLSFVNAVNRSGADGLLIGGDISSYDSLAGHLALLASTIDIPIYFVLGNHDAYGGSIHDSKRVAREACRHQPRLNFLEDSGVVHLSKTVCLAGVGGWADARAGDFLISPKLLNDYFLVRELIYLPDRIARDVLRELGDRSADRLREILAGVPGRCRELVVLVHVPPWKDVCWYGGKISDDRWLPHYTCVAVGEAIEEFAVCHPDTSVLVLCGHTHGGGEVRISGNVLCKTGPATYGAPEVKEVIEIVSGDED